MTQTVKKEITQKLKIATALSLFIMIAGISMLVYMIKVEDEPGALPLLLILIGTVWLILIKLKHKKQMD